MTTSPAPVPPPLATQKSDFTAEGSPPPGMVATSAPQGSTDAVALLETLNGALDDLRLYRAGA